MILVIGILTAISLSISFIKAILLCCGVDIRDLFIKRKYVLPQSVSDKATFEVTSTQELLEVAGRYPFVEKLLTETRTKKKGLVRYRKRNLFF
jgi:hypothetical protein